MNNAPSYDRYQRQVMLKELGENGQQKLLNTKVLVIGAGGLGCPVLHYLAAAGVGTIGIVDDDTIALHNLHRQPLYNNDDIGLPKALVAARKLEALNPSITVIAHNERLISQNAISIITPYDIILDGTDNFSTRYLINDACVLLNKPIVYGAISRYEGQVAVFNCSTGQQDNDPVNYRDLFPEPPADGEVLNCAESGVLGVLPGIIGTMMANETIKLITAIGVPLINRLLTFNALNNQVYEFQISKRPGTQSMIPRNAEALESMDYHSPCAAVTHANEIEAREFDTLLSLGEVQVIDVREYGEAPEIHEFEHLKIPFGNISSMTGDLYQPTIVLFCQTGKRSRDAAGILAHFFGNKKKVLSLKGGIQHWKQQHNSVVK